MTQVIHTLETLTRRRTVEQRRYRLYSALGFVVFLPIVAVGRLLPQSPRRRRIDPASHQRLSLVAETRAEVSDALACLTMV